MSATKHTIVWEGTMKDYVLADDYDSLLAVLRRCVRAMERHAGSAACLLWTRDKENDAALAAAREYTEGEKETGK